METMADGLLSRLSLGQEYSDWLEVLEPALRHVVEETAGGDAWKFVFPGAEETSEDLWYVVTAVSDYIDRAAVFRSKPSWQPWAQHLSLRPMTPGNRYETKRTVGFTSKSWRG